MRAARDAQPHHHPQPSSALAAITDRRAALKRALGAAAGVAVAGSALAVAAAEPAAADGTALLSGVANTSTGPTSLHNSGVGAYQNVLTVDDQNLGGSAYPAAIGGYASGSGGNVRHGVFGYSQAPSGAALVGWGGAHSVDLLLVPFGGAPINRGIPAAGGSVHCDGSSTIWACVEDGTPGTWRKVAGPTTAGQLHVLPAPKRCYDSRAYAPAGGGVKGVLAGGTGRTVDTKNNGTGVPASATAVMVNLTVTSASSAGWVALVSNAVGEWPGTSNLNWEHSGQVVANMAVVAVDANAMVKAYANADTHFLIDVVGYYQ
jgi:hypothetical protein